MSYEDIQIPSFPTRDLQSQQNPKINLRPVIQEIHPVSTNPEIKAVINMTTQEIESEDANSLFLYDPELQSIDNDIKNFGDLSNSTIDSSNNSSKELGNDSKSSDYPSVASDDLSKATFDDLKFPIKDVTSGHVYTSDEIQPFSSPLSSPPKSPPPSSSSPPPRC